MISRTRVALFSTLLNIMITLCKGLLAFVSGSSALIAETIHSLSDLIGSLVVLTGMRISGYKSKEFPLGLYKVENFVALFSSIIIFFAGYEIAKKALDFQKETDISRFPLSIGGMILLMIVISVFMKYEQKMAERFNSPALKADAFHWRVDIASAFVVLLGLFGSWIGYFYADRIAAIIIVIFIAKSGWNIMTDSMKSLLDASVGHTTIDKIRQVISKYPEVSEIKSVIARNAGSFIFTHIELRLSLKSLREAHQLSERLESEIKNNISWVERVFIHYEPIIKENIIYAIPLEDTKGKLSDHYGEAPFISLIKTRRKGSEIIERDIVENPFINLEKGKGIKLSEFLVEKGIDVLILREMFHGDGPKYVFSNADIEFRLTDKTELKDIIDDIQSKKEGVY